MADSVPNSFQLHAITISDRVAGWESLGFTVESDPNSTKKLIRLGQTALIITEPEADATTRGILGWQIDGVDSHIDGIPTITQDTEPSSVGSLTAEPPAHSNRIDRIDHIVVRTGDTQRTIQQFQAAGLEPRRGRETTSYGSPMLQTFFWLGDVILELVGPAVGEPTTDEEPTFFGLALVSSDLDASAAVLGELLGTPRPAVQENRLIAGLKTKFVDVAVPIVVMSPHVKGSATEA